MNLPVALAMGLGLAVAPVLAIAQETEATIPPGAVALGYTKCIIDERPAVVDIAPGKNGAFKWFSGQWYSRNPPSLDHYQDKDSCLALKPGGNLVSAPLDFSAPGLLPALPGADGFYVEFEVRLSDNDPDHWPAVWLMPVEHNGKQQDHYPNDPPGFERWMELDVDEGGFGPGLTGTVHSCTDIWPHYQHIQNPNNVVRTPLDRTQTHVFGASYDPCRQSVTWWVDGVRQMEATAPHVPEIATQQHFYLIVSAQSHGKKLDYLMFLGRVRAYTLPSSPIPAAGKPAP